MSSQLRPRRTAVGLSKMPLRTGLAPSSGLVAALLLASLTAVVHADRIITSSSSSRHHHHVIADRIVQNFDFGWKFSLGENPGYNQSAGDCPIGRFPLNFDGKRCNGLRRATAGDASLDACRGACCVAAEGCEIYQYDPDNGASGPCWIGMLPPDPDDPDKGCVNDTAWSSRARASPTAPSGPPKPSSQPCPTSPTCTDYEDAGWRDLDVPHDFVVEGSFQPNATKNHGFLPFNIGWYRKHFELPASAEGKSVYLDFDGVYRAADFWLNGQWVGHHESGYAPFRWYIHNISGAKLNTGAGAKNVLAVHVDALHFQEGWFYEGGGIYRHVQLTIADPVAILPWGVAAPSVIAPGAKISGALDEPQTAEAAVVSTQVDIANALTTNQSYSLTTKLLAEDGTLVVSASLTGVLEPGGWARVQAPLKFPAKPPASGAMLQLSPCTGSVVQQFEVDPESGTVSIAGAGSVRLCVDITEAPEGTNKPPTLMPCVAGKKSQQLGYAIAGPYPKHFVVDPKAGHCLDVDGGYNPGAKTAKLDVFSCHPAQPLTKPGVNQQQFYIDAAAHAVHVIGNELCLEAADVSLPSGLTLVHGPAADPVVQLWNLHRPYLYTLATELVTASTSDSVNVTIGVRSAVFSADHGFVLNGIPQKIKGLSQHQDFAGCGTAMPDAVNEYRVTQLIKMGATGWRTAHNPVNKEILDYTDKHGMLVWNENRNLERQVIGVAAAASTSMRLGSSVRRAAFTDVDGTWVGAEWKGVDPQYLDDMQALVLRDRNHPSVIIWSLCNEGGCMQGDPDGGYVGAAFKKAIFDCDDSRPVTANSEDTAGDTLTKVMDVNSFSYNYAEYDTFHIKYPFRTIIGGESASCVSDRTTYLGAGQHSNSTTGHVDADDSSCAVAAWGTSAATRPWIVGNFAWTGHDYKGEPTPSDWPTINSHFGVIDIAGFPKDDTNYYYSWWKNDTKALHILPQDWNAPVPEGAPLNMVVYSAAASVELKVNGVSLGRKPVVPFNVVKYTEDTEGAPIVFKPGKLEATSYDQAGNIVATATVATTGPASSLNLSLDKPVGINGLRYSGPAAGIAGDGQDVALVRVEVIDSAGAVVPSAENNITFSVSGPGHIYGVGNGDPTDHDPDKATYRKAYKGLARVIVQSKASATPGSITFTATAVGLKTATLSIAVV